MYLTSYSRIKLNLEKIETINEFLKYLEIFIFSNFLIKPTKIIFQDIQINKLDILSDNLFIHIYLDKIENNHNNTYSIYFYGIYENIDEKIISGKILTSEIDFFNFPEDLFNFFIYSYVKKYINNNSKIYHSIFLINKKIKELEKISYNFTELERKILYLVICFQNIIYQPENKFNEEESAEFFKNEFNYYENKDILNWIIQLIYSTKINFDYKILMSIKFADLIHDLNYLEFADLSELKLNNNKLEFELKSIYNHKQFLEKQNKFFNDLLNMPYNFYYSKFYNHLNLIAINNVKEMKYSIQSKLYSLE